MSDEELRRVIAVEGRLIGRAKADGIESLSPAERVVVLAPWAVDLISDGGFRSFYKVASNTLDVADALDELGFPEAAAACRIAHAAVPGSALMGGVEARHQWLESLDEAELEARFHELDRTVWEVADRLYDALARHIDRHQLWTSS